MFYIIIRLYYKYQFFYNNYFKRKIYFFKCIYYIMSKTFVLETKAGLCNRLRAVFSYYKSLENTNTKMIVIWKPDIHCPGYFLDYFKPVPGITFLR